MKDYTINKTELKKVLYKYYYPLYFVRFKFTNSIKQIFLKECKIPYQYSLYIVYGNGTTLYKEYEGEYLDLMKNLVSNLNHGGCIISYTEDEDNIMFYYKMEFNLNIDLNHIPLKSIFEKGYYSKQGLDYSDIANVFQALELPKDDSSMGIYNLYQYLLELVKPKQGGSLMYKYMVSYGWDIIREDLAEISTKEEYEDALRSFWKYPRCITFGCYTLKEVKECLRKDKLYYTQYVVIKSLTNEIVMSKIKY